MNEKVTEYLRNAYKSLKEEDEEEALEYLKEALQVDYEHQEVLYALKCLKWWLEKIKCLNDFHDPYEKGGFILSQWKSYYEFLDRIEEARFLNEKSEDSCQYALKRFVFSRALSYFLVLLQDGSNQQDPELLYQAGRCCKGAGNWEEALVYLEQASRLKREDSAILSELADVNALLGNERAAKVLFREAFFLDPQGIDLSGLESSMIVRLRDKVQELGHQGNELAEWIPIWGNIWGVFSVKRELKPVELGRLKQSILSLENEYRNKNDGLKPGQEPLIKPRLLNRYFWLIDYCEHKRDTAGYQGDGLMDDTMLKIKFIDPAIHGHYRT